MDSVRDILGRETAAFVMAVVFAQGMFAGFVHFEVVSHFYCPEHDRVTHDRSHVEDLDVPGERASSDEGAAEKSDGSAPERNREGKGHGCEWLTWFQDSSVATPALAVAYLDIPEPQAVRSSRIGPEYRRENASIPLGHVSPINSPPRS